MQKRKFDELISHFNRKVADMSIDQKYKMELLGMISAIGFAHEKELGTNLAEVGTDCISRQAAIEALERAKQNIRHNIERAIGDAICEILDEVESGVKQLPPIQPKRGRWIKLDMHRGMADHKCTACKQECYVPTCMGEPMYAYCPNCGAKMEVNNESN